MDIDLQVKFQKHENPNHTPQKYFKYEFGGLAEREHLKRHTPCKVMRLAGTSQQVCFTIKHLNMLT